MRDSSTGAYIAIYAYDALDRLFVVWHPGGDYIAFRYVGLTTRVAQIVDLFTGSVLRSVANGWNGERLVDWTGSGSDQRFYGTNGHHDVTWTADSAGAVSATLRYDPWGNLTASSGSYLPTFRYQGSWFDPSTSLSWVVARWYAPSLGRFVSEDALLGQPADPSSRHLYAYADGDPVNRMDVTGRAATGNDGGSSLCYGGRYLNACSRRVRWTIRNPTHARGYFRMGAFIRAPTQDVILPFVWGTFQGDGRDFDPIRTSTKIMIQSRGYFKVDFDARTVTAQVNPSCGTWIIPRGDWACHNARNIDTSGGWITGDNSITLSETDRGVITLHYAIRDSAVFFSEPTDGLIVLRPPMVGGKIRIELDTYPSWEMYYSNGRMYGPVYRRYGEELHGLRGADWKVVLNWPRWGRD